MTIETKYSIGDTVWVMEGNTPTPKKLLGIRTYTGDGTTPIDPGKTSVQYYAKSGLLKEGDMTYYNQSVLFPTKEALLASL